MVLTYIILTKIFYIVIDLSTLMCFIEKYLTNCWMRDNFYYADALVVTCM